MKVFSLFTNDGFLKTHKLGDNVIMINDQVRKNLIKIIMQRRHSALKVDGKADNKTVTSTHT
jgi:hypothetical protein